jgi:hypothetical protein
MDPKIGGGNEQAYERKRIKKTHGGKDDDGEEQINKTSEFTFACS